MCADPTETAGSGRLAGRPERARGEVSATGGKGGVATMARRARKSRARKKKKANHGRRPTAR
ncbi:hypothetical protein C1I98_06405 [Spongiactinospora gelatinilytica]|uniref:Uncharacterized protein n=1 Tax=Spongiactinospora gelatinilytica TaxID=2666298 RepID=A0A2W2I4B7_9ACTN|nr:hypothetical protein C1I98_06405 [Spongiactinospora gelatinilytica]